jgi:uncharacterized hydrophobic protein (TIGR00271 family)
MGLLFFKNFSEKNKAEAVQNLITESSPRRDFFIMIGLSILMATFGLLLDSVAVIIGSMLVAPLLYPLLSFSLGVVIADFKLMGRSIYTIVRSSLLGITLATLTTLLFSVRGFELTNEIIARTQPSLDWFFVAIIAGAAASLAALKPQLNARLTGVAISVALIPPIAVIGIGAARLNWAVVQPALILYLLNILGVIFASTIVFSMLQVQVQKKVVAKAVKKDEKTIAKEEKQAQQAAEKEKFFLIEINSAADA